jgi:uncharacterized membrane protein YbhN (UPF0104 family)
MANKSYFKNLSLIGLKVSFIIFVFYFIFSKVDRSILARYFINSNIALLFASFIVLNISQIFSALRSRYYFSTHGLKFSSFFAISFYYIGILFNVILPGGIGGDGYKVYLLWKLEKFSKLKSLRIIFYERVSGIFILIIFGLILYFFSDFYKKFYLLDLFAILSSIMVVPCYFLSVKYIIRDRIQTAFYASFYSLFVQLFQVIGALLLIYAIDPNPSHSLILNFLLLFIIASIIAIFPISIGGAGLRELTFIYGLTFIGEQHFIEAGVAFALLIFILYTFTAFIGLPFFLLRKNQKVK